MTGFGISQTLQSKNGPVLFKLFQAYYDGTTGHKNLRFEVFRRETGKFGQGIYTIMQNLVASQHVRRYNYV